MYWRKLGWDGRDVENVDTAKDLTGSSVRRSEQELVDGKAAAAVAEED